MIAAHIALVSGANASSESAASPWYQGTITAALAEAKAQNKHILLYWGAVWCPPCNELKSQVFSRQRFAELMRPMIAVALDGDSEEAQAWGEKLHVQGYPTVLLLAPGGQELMRLPTAVNMEEFEASLSNALKNPNGFDSALNRGLSGTASPDEWKLLANYTWHEDMGKDDRDKLVQKLMVLTTNIPREMAADRARLVTLFLTTAAAANTDGANTAEIRQRAAKEMSWLYSDKAATLAARSLFAYSPDVQVWLYPTGDSHSHDADQLWLQAAASVAASEDSSIDTRLWASVAPMVLYRARHPGTTLPSELRDLVVREVALSDRTAKSPYDRKAVISGAAMLLRDVGDFDGARKLLTKELARTDTPWYLLAAAANLEKAAGNDAKALTLIAKARKSARGRASKLQWIQADIAMTASIQNPQQVARLTKLVKDFYQTASSLDDGFQGRNARTAAKVASAIQPLLNQRPIQKAVAKAAKQCQKQKHPEPCQEHFAAFGQFLN